MSKTIYLAKGAELLSAEADIQLMPPGTHTISPMRADGSTATLTVTVDARAAEALEASRRQYAEAAANNQGDAPYIDFNHADGEAAAWVKEIYWAGDDPRTGGIRAKVEWSSAGRQAIEGKLFRRFSPSFYVDEKTGNITGAPVNMGGLVNRAAFTTIAPVTASTANQPTPPTKPTMSEEEIQKIITENTQLKDQLQMLRAQIEKLSASLAQKDEKLAEAAKEKAEAATDAAISAGRILPDQRDKWVLAILNNPDAATLLASLPPNPAFQQIVNPTPTHTSSSATGISRLALALKNTTK